MANKDKTSLEEKKALAKKADCPEKPGSTFLIAGIGASAGGLAALEAFFANLPHDLEAKVAFVLVQHLPPNYKSILGELLQRCTGLKVCEAQDGMMVAPNMIYTAPPNIDLTIQQGRLKVIEPAAYHSKRFPIDVFFRSLAADQGEQAVCIILSGGGSDGTLGMKAVKAEGGMAMVQDPGSAECKSMAQSAIATGLPDFVGPPGEMPAQLDSYFRTRNLRPVEALLPKSENLLGAIFDLLHARTGHDFSGYKQSTVSRRIEKRLAINFIEDLTEYLHLLHANPEEVQALFRDFLVGVTGFFRDPDAFKALRVKVLPRILAGKKPGETLRVWVAGCSTGEEAYSLAILFKECMEESQLSAKVQIFATDIDSNAIRHARQGFYPVNIAADVSPERLKRFFLREEDGNNYRIQKTIREMIIFAEHNVTTDPPFSRMDLVSCRNLFIYLGSKLQKKVLQLFHYAMHPDSFLFLGTSETTGDYNYFIAVDRKWKLYRRKQGGTPSPGKIIPLISKASSRSLTLDNKPDTSIEQIIYRMLLKDYAPACAVINRHGEMLYIHGRSGKYLEPASGAVSHNIMKMAREGLKSELAGAIYRAASQNEPVYCRGLKVTDNGEATLVDLTVKPFPEGHPDVSELFLVLFENTKSLINVDHGEEAALAALEAAAVAEPATDQRAAALERELQDRDEYLQSVVEELESANEELLSTIEEFHSTSEELETSREELQSINEELVTINAELQTKNEELARTINDMNNMIVGTGIGTIFVDQKQRIKRFTPLVTRVINLIDGDLGRPLNNITSNLVGYDQLEADVQVVLDTLESKEVEVRVKNNEWYRLRIIPYRTVDNDVEGAVINFINITEIKELQQQLSLELGTAKLLQDLSTQLIQTDNVEALYDQILITLVKMLSSDGAIIQKFYPERGTEGELYMLRQYGYGEFDTSCWEWVTPDKKSSCGLALKTRQRVTFVDVLQCDYMAGGDCLEQYHKAGIRSVQTTPLFSRSGVLLGMISAHWREPHELKESEVRNLDVLARQAADLIERTHSEEALREREERYRILSEQLKEADHRKDDFLGALSHEIRNPLASIALGLSLLDRAAWDTEKAKQAREIMSRQVSQLSRLVDDLLDVTRIAQDLIVLQKEQVELRTLVNSIRDDYLPMFQEKGVSLTIEPPLPNQYVDADPVRLTQILGNLLHNSVKFTQSGGNTSIIISCNNEKQLAIIKVKDDGLGMTPKTIECLFQPFMQADSSLDRSNGGLGLGLALVKGLMELHGGHIEACSNGLGKGSMFTLYLPLSGQPTNLLKKKEPDLTRKVHRQRILLIEDTKDVAEILRALLEEEGHEVMVAGDGIKGVEIAKQYRPDVVLCDVGLPGMDGFQVAQAIRKDDIVKDTLLISLTGYARPEDIQRAKEAGFDFQLSKPVDITELQKVLQSR